MQCFQVSISDLFQPSQSFSSWAINIHKVLLHIFNLLNCDLSCTYVAFKQLQVGSQLEQSRKEKQRAKHAECGLGEMRRRGSL